MAEKQTDADKAAAMTEYRQQHNAAVDRIAALRAARIARDASAPPPAPKVKAKPVAKTGGQDDGQDREQDGHQGSFQDRDQVAGPGRSQDRAGRRCTEAGSAGQAPQLNFRFRSPLSRGPDYSPNNPLRGNERYISN